MLDKDIGCGIIEVKEIGSRMGRKRESEERASANNFGLLDRWVWLRLNGQGFGWANREFAGTPPNVLKTASTCAREKAHHVRKYFSAYIRSP